MEKSIFILREPVWIYNDEDSYRYGGVNEIYKKFTIYEEALAEKNKLNTQIAKDDKLAKGEFKKFNFAKIIEQKNVFAYFKEHFGMDWNRIWESDAIDKSKVTKKEFQKAINAFIRKKALQNDNHIIYLLNLIKLEFYQIVEIKEKDCIYKIIGNKNFKDFSVLQWNKQEYESEDYFMLLEQAEQQINYLFCNYLYRIDEEDNIQMKGSLSDLSEAPNILEGYIKNHSHCFVYDNENKKLFIKGISRKGKRYNKITHLQEKEKIFELMRGFIALLRPEKNPFVVKSIPTSEIPEKYLEYERRIQQGEEERKKWLENNPSNDDDLPF